MRIRILGIVLAGLIVAFAPSRPAFAADAYELDKAHAAFNFKISHLGLSWTYGRFNDLAGDFTIDGDKSAFELKIKTDSIDTGNPMRDTHLKHADFFDAKKFPTISFKSTAVKPTEDGFDVTGDLTMHGVAKSITFPLKGGTKGEFPKGVTRTGYSTELKIKRSDFGMEGFKGAVGDDVYISISFEGTLKK